MTSPVFVPAQTPAAAVIPVGVVIPALAMIVVPAAAAATALVDA